jgi:outer membrane protein
MKKVLLAITAALALMVSSITPAMAADTKIGVINLQQLLQQLPQMKQISADMKKQFGDREKKIVDAEDQLKKDADSYKRNGAVMSAKDKQATEDKLMKQQQELQQMQISFQRDFQTAQNKAIDDLLSKIKVVVEKIAVQNQLNLVLINASVAYADKSLDITDPVLKQMGK